jgi:hypothetical protein
MAPVHRALVALLVGLLAGCERPSPPVSPPPSASAAASQDAVPLATGSTIAEAPVPIAHDGGVEAGVEDADAAPPVQKALAEIMELPSPGKGWQKGEPEPARGYVCYFFGGAGPSRCPMLQPLGSWTRRGRSVVSAYRLAASAGIAKRPPDAPKPAPFGAGRMFYELPSDGTQFFWVVSNGFVLQAKDALAEAQSLRTAFRAWAPHALDALEAHSGNADPNSH